MALFDSIVFKTELDKEIIIRNCQPKDASLLPSFLEQIRKKCIHINGQREDEFYIAKLL